MTLPRETTVGTGCEPSKRRMYWCAVAEEDGCWAPCVHANCVHNEQAALLLRTLGPTPDDPVHPLLDQAFKEIAGLTRKLKVERWSLERVVNSYSGKMKTRYAEAMNEANTRDLTRADKKLAAFLKAEKFNTLLKYSKPRMIMARSPMFNLLLASYLKPLEHALWRALRGSGGTSTRQVGKGLNGVRRASLLARKMEEMGDCVVFEVDGKSFESHISASDIGLEHSVYLTAYPGDPELRRLLHCQQSLKGTTSCGIKYGRPGARASGDFNTGLGNTLIMLGSCRAGMRHLEAIARRKIQYDLLADGDNCLIFVRRSDAKYVHDNFAAAVRVVSNQELAVENPVSSLEEVTFGQCKPCWNGDMYNMVRDPWKVLSNSFSSYRHYNNYVHGVKVLKAVSECELALARGIPVLQPYFAAALDRLKDVPDLSDPSTFLEARLLEPLAVHGTWDAIRRLGTKEISVQARQSFETSWGISVEEQIIMERRLVDNLRFPKEPKTFVRQDFVVDWESVDVYDGPGGGTFTIMDEFFLRGRNV